MEAANVKRREPLTPGQRKKRVRRILLFGGLVIAVVLAVRIGGSYVWNYHIQPRMSQKEAYREAQAAIEQNDPAAAIEALAHAGARDALGNFFFSPMGGVAAYKDAEALRLSLEREMLQSAAVGDAVYWGQYEQDTDPLNGREAIVWQVVAREGDALTLISLYGLDCHAYQNEYLPVSWANSSLREWLNGSFLSSAFLLEERAAIARHENADAANPVFGTEGGKETVDHVYVPSIEEALAWFPSDGERIAQSTAYAKAWGANYREEACWWWLRNPGDTAHRKAVVHNDGSIYYEGYTITMYNTATVRPVINLDLTRLGAQS